MLSCIAFELAALSFDGDVDENVTKRSFRCCTHIHQVAIGLPDSRHKMRKQPASCYKDLEVFEETDLA